MKKRGQAAMEFLMTYGWAILVVLVVIGALAYFGVLNPQQFLPKKCQFGTGIVCEDHLICATCSSTGGPEGKIRINNGIGTTMQVTDIKIDDETYDAATGTRGGLVACDCTDCATSGPIPAGQSATFTLSCTAPAAGTRFKGPMRLSYTDMQTNFAHTSQCSILTDIE